MNMIEECSEMFPKIYTVDMQTFRESHGTQSPLNYHTFLVHYVQVHAMCMVLILNLNTAS